MKSLIFSTLQLVCFLSANIKRLNVKIVAISLPMAGTQENIVVPAPETAILTACAERKQTDERISPMKPARLKSKKETLTGRFDKMD
jgi:hypothetical protein